MEAEGGVHHSVNCCEGIDFCGEIHVKIAQWDGRRRRGCHWLPSQTLLASAKKLILTSLRLRASTFPQPIACSARAALRGFRQWVLLFHLPSEWGFFLCIGL